MYTAAALARIRKLQGVFSTLALLNLSGNLFPEEANIYDKSTYDYVVVGGGSAGVVLGARLAEANYSTLIIEAGGNPDLETKYPGLLTYIKGSKMDWNFTTEPDGITGKCHKSDDKSITNHLLPSGKVLGGSGITSFMVYGRGLPSDYEKISKTAKDSSFNWKNMLKYFKKSEKLVATKVLESKYGKYHSAKGKIGVTKEDRPNCNDYLRLFKQAGERVVVDNIGAGILGYSTALYRILDGIRSDGACAYLIPLKNNLNLQITRHSVAAKIIFDKNKNAVGVEFVKNGRIISVKARKEVIITTGPIKSPQLLMLSGIGPKKELEKMDISVLSDLPVGKNLQNNVGALLVFQTNRTADPGPLNVHYYPTKLIVGHSALNKSSSIPEYTTLSHIVDDTDFFLSFCGFTVGLKNEICDKLYSLAKQHQIFMGVVLHPNPKSRGTIELKSTDPCDQPKINTGYFTNRDDLEALVDYIMDYMKIESTQHAKSLGLKFMRGAEKCDKHKFGSKAYWKCYALCMTTTLSNEGGTCSIGSVVDSKLKVIGVNRLRVVDASVIPNTIASHIYSSVVAFAEKAADMILGKK